MKFIEMVDEDLDWFLNIRNSCVGCLHDSTTYSIEECREWFKRLPANKTYYKIMEEGFYIGYFRTEIKDFPYMDDTKLKIMYIGADLHEDYRGRGLAKQAYIEFMEAARKELKVEYFELEVLGDNIVAYNLYRSLGFEVKPPKIIACKSVNYEVFRSGRRIPSIRMGRR